MLKMASLALLMAQMGSNAPAAQWAPSDTQKPKPQEPTHKRAKVKAARKAKRKGKQ
jgi:hypothetical protein